MLLGHRPSIALALRPALASGVATQAQDCIGGLRERE
jgi:hypothetical protein